MMKKFFVAWGLVFIVGCATNYPNVSHMLPENSAPLPLEVNIDCFKTFRGFIKRCSEDYSKELIQNIRTKKLFAEVVSGENQFLDKHQITVRVDINEVGDPQRRLFVLDRSSIIRWRAWNSAGSLLDKEETFAYRARDPVDISRILDWHMKVAEDSYVELKKKSVRLRKEY